MVVAVLTGLRAQEMMSHGKGSLVYEHKNYMLVALAVAVLLTLVLVRRWRETSRQYPFVLVVGLVLLNGVLVLGADRGARVAQRFRAGLDLYLPVPLTPPHQEEDDVLQGNAPGGRLLYDRFACAGCHSADRSIEAPGIPPTLAYAGSRMRPEGMHGYLRQPHRRRWLETNRRPLTRMPDFQLTVAEATDLVAFLARRQDTGRFPPGPVAIPPLTRQEALEGRDLFRQYACKGCHRLGGTGNALGPVLDGVGELLQPGYIYALLKAPKAVIPGTPMTDFNLWDEEVRSLTAYLVALQSPSQTPSPMHEEAP